VKDNKSAPTIQDVAREAGVSPSTVSNVLNRRWRQTSKETRERILEVAQRLNYQPNAMAAALRRRSTRTIGVIVTSVLNPFYTAVVRGIQDEARRNGYTTILGNTDDDPEQERDMLNTLRAKQVDGILIVTTGGCHDTIQHVNELGVPVVLVDRGDPALNLDAVGVDNALAAENAVNYLIGLGHERIAIVSGLITGVPTRAHRLQGYLKALAGAGLPAPEAYQQILSTSVENGSAAAGRLLDLPAPPTAIMATNTFMAIGVIHEIHRRELNMPAEISFLMFDDPEWATLHRPGITTVAQPIREVAGGAFQLLEARMLKKKTGDREVLAYPTSLIVRGSCGPARN
jgi:DNA-binding LacI/PurR family transcriptional regulator